MNMGAELNENTQNSTQLVVMPRSSSGFGSLKGLNGSSLIHFQL